MSLASGQSTAPTAFLALDFTNYIVANYSADPSVVDRAATTIAAARTAGLQVIHVVPEPMIDDIHPAVVPVGTEPVLAKTTIGAFATTNLDAILKAQQITQIVLMGVATSGTVLSTARWAFDVGYNVVVCSDACSDQPATHAALIDPTVHADSWLGLWRIATVVPAAEISVLGGR
jgi:nicotinamidase-related amidase